MSKLIGAVAIAGCSLSLMLPVPVRAQEERESMPPAARRHFASYSDCARKHLEDEARRNPSASFERIEGSLRPACGSHIALVRDALFRIGLGPGEANAVIRSAYASLQPSLRQYFEQIRSSEKDRRQAAETPPSPAESGTADQEQIKAVERERSKFLSEASSVYDACLGAETKNLAPHSNETAETLMKVIEIKCAEPEKRVVGLGFAFYGASKASFHSLVEAPLEERKKRLVADIVTLRADLAKESAKTPKDAPAAGASPDPVSGTPAPTKQP